MSLSTHLHLHQRILLSLSRQPATSITALARDLETLRPSISRAVTSLLDKQLVAKDGRRLSLTRKGEAEVALIKETLPARAQKTSAQVLTAIEQANKSLEQVSRLVDIQAISALQQHTPQIHTVLDSIKLAPLFAIQPPIVKAMQDFTALHKSIDTSLSLQAQEVAKSMQAAFDTSAFKHLQVTMKEMASVQSINLEWLQKSTYPLNQVLVENNAYMSTIIRDLAALSKAPSTLVSSLEGLAYHVTEVTSSYEAYYIDLGKQLLSLPSFSNGLAARVVIPTTTTATFVGSIRSIIGSQEKSQAGTSIEYTASIEDQVIFPLIEHYLAPAGDRFIRKWHGAWQTLSSSSEDRYSQALHSGRELLMQVLADLAPDTVFTSEDLANYKADKPTRRMRIKHILCKSKTAVDWVEKVAAAIDATYDIFAAESHKRDDTIPNTDSAASLLLALGGVIAFLLQNQDKSSSE